MDKYQLFDRVAPIIGRPFRKNTITPVIYYHSIVDRDGASYQHTDYNVFKKHMLFLKEEGYSFLGFHEIPEMFRKRAEEKKIIIAFDDGYEDNYSNIFGFMKSNGIKYNIFLAMSFIGLSGYLNKKQIRIMRDSGLVHFGTHTHTHINCVKDFGKLADEIRNSNEAYISLIGDQPEDFCFPFGAYSTESVLYISQNGGYKRIYTSDFLRPREINGICITGRLGIRNEDTVDVLKHKIDGDYYPLHYIADKKIKL